MTEEKDEDVPPHSERLPLWPEFAFFYDNIDGRIPACRVESWQDFIANLDKEKDDPTGVEKIYRGHRRYDWQLESTLTRQFEGGSIPREILDKLKRRFLLAMRGRGSDLSKLAEDEIWAFGQHSGLATPLLDWTESPFVALFFAFSNEDMETEKENPTRAIFCLNRDLIEGELKDLFFEPTLGENARLVNQAGLFTVTPAGEDNLTTAIINQLVDSGAVSVDNPEELARYICKIHIPNEERKECLNMLRKMNIHHANLFPDPGGASQYCNDWLSRFIDAQHQQELEKKEVERKAKHPEIKARELAKSPEGTSELVAQLLTEGVPDHIGFPEEMLAEWAEKIDSKYQEDAALDWPKHPSSKAKIGVAFKRLLKVLGYPGSAVDVVADKLVSFYEARYIENHQSEANADD